MIYFVIFVIIYSTIRNLNEIHPRYFIQGMGTLLAYSIFITVFIGFFINNGITKDILSKNRPEDRDVNIVESYGEIKEFKNNEYGGLEINILGAPDQKGFFNTNIFFVEWDREDSYIFKVNRHSLLISKDIYKYFVYAPRDKCLEYMRIANIEYDKFLIQTPINPLEYLEKDE